MIGVRCILFSGVGSRSSPLFRYKEDFGDTKSDVLYFIFDYVSPAVQVQI